LHGKVLVDFIGRYENLTHDFREACRRIGIQPPRLAHRRQASDRSDYRGYYDDATAALIAEHFRPDVELFGYTF
jgi:hypothetical protein